MSEADKHVAMRAQLKELAAQFLQRCLADMTTAHALLGRLYGGEPEVINDLAQLAHRVAGTGGSLGFDSISRSAAAIERFAERQIAGERPDPRAPQSLAELTIALERDVAAALRAV